MLSHHGLEKDEFSKIFYTPRTITAMVFTLLVLNVLAYTIVPMHSAANINADSPKDGWKYTSKM